MMERWVEEEKSDACSYAHDAVEQLLKTNMKLQEENRELKAQLKKLLWMMEEKD